MSLAFPLAVSYVPFRAHLFSARCNSCRRNIICKSALISRMEGASPAGGTRRSGATAFRGRQFRAAAWRSSHAFPRFSVCSCVAVPIASFFSSEPSLIRILPGQPSSCLSSQVVFVVAPCLIRGSLIRARGRAHRSVLLRLVKLTLNSRPGLPLRFISSSPFPRRFLSLTRRTRTRKSTRALKTLQSRGLLEANAFDRWFMHYLHRTHRDSPRVWN